MNTITEAINIIMGEGKSGGYYLAGFFFSVLGIIISVRMHSINRDVLSPNTPIKYNWKFLLWDNFKRIFTGLIVMFILFRMFDLSNVWAMIGVGVFVGLGVDKAIQFIMEKTDFLNLLKTDRTKFNKK